MKIIRPRPRPRPRLHESVLLLVLLGSLPGCGQRAADHEAHDAGSSQAESIQAGSSHAEEARTTEIELQLDEGRRWPLDEPTRAHVARMTERIEDLDPATADAETLRRTGGELSDDLDSLIRGCTMTGEAHQQLHLYLTALIPAVDGFAAGDAEAASRVAELLRMAPTYFE